MNQCTFPYFLMLDGVSQTRLIVYRFSVPTYSPYQLRICPSVRPTKIHIVTVGVSVAKENLLSSFKSLRFYLVP